MGEEEMRNKMIIAVSLVVAGVMTYLMFSGLDEDFYHFPWKVFAGFGIMSWLVREGLKLVRDVKKELRNGEGSSISLSACHSWYG
ncbi:hypothetical protein [Streptococcus pneumoniae]